MTTRQPATSPTPVAPIAPEPETGWRALGREINIPQLIGIFLTVGIPAFTLILGGCWWIVQRDADRDKTLAVQAQVQAQIQVRQDKMETKVDDQGKVLNTLVTGQQHGQDKIDGAMQVLQRIQLDIDEIRNRKGK